MGAHFRRTWVKLRNHGACSGFGIARGQAKGALMPDQKPTLPRVRMPYDQGDALAVIISVIAVWFAVLSVILGAGFAMFAAIGATTSVFMG
jgi:hypothetical protein